MVFCNECGKELEIIETPVTILILVDGFLQYGFVKNSFSYTSSHNPYFSRWFSAMQSQYSDVLQGLVTILILVDGFLQCRICRVC